MELLDLCPLETWTTLEDEIYSTSQLNPAVYNTKGIRIHRSHRWPNRLCPEIKSIPKGQSFICATAHMNLANTAKNTRRPVIEECDAGMVKLLVPVIVDDTYLGSVGGCGKIFEGGEVDTYLVNKITGMEEDKVEALAGEVPSITMEHARELADFIQGRIGGIVSAFLDRGRGRSPKGP
ncbi:PocR ligand-binding domain-containing protein [Desulfosarcina sp.]|jgi:ligand-binding sensor protein|uniref:PocR ligand-binding domain-containing protein n=1 Tax=Desulfosarcina sp. TaxID=2027861 RepID=UPI003970743E